MVQILFLKRDSGELNVLLKRHKKKQQTRIIYILLGCLVMLMALSGCQKRSKQYDYTSPEYNRSDYVDVLLEGKAWYTYGSQSKVYFKEAGSSEVIQLRCGCQLKCGKSGLTKNPTEVSVKALELITPAKIRMPIAKSIHNKASGGTKNFNLSCFA